MQIQLVGEENPGAAATSERQLVHLVELLVEAGAPCGRFLADHWPAAAAAAATVGPGSAAAAAAAAAAGARATAAAAAAAATGGSTAGLQRPPALVFPSLLLAAGLPAWSPSTHQQWPPAFRRAAREALLVLRGRGVPAAAEQAGNSARLMQQHSTAGQHARLHLPVEMCHLILQKAASRVSCWVQT